MKTDLYPSKNKVRQVGSILASAEPDEATRAEAIRIMGLWRSAHEPALHAIFRKMRDIPNQYRGAIVAARLKRLATIEGKLRRPGTTFQLNTMYDIAGCRCILPNVDDLRTVQSRIESEESIRKSHDYLTYPKTSGYRGSHLIVDVALPNSPYGKLPVEIQLRTKLQHLWSTAVEAFDICQKQASSSTKSNPRRQRGPSRSSQISLRAVRASPCPRKRPKTNGILSKSLKRSTNASTSSTSSAPTQTPSRSSPKSPTGQPPRPPPVTCSP